MPYAAPEVRASSWSEDDYLTRAAEMRSEFAALPAADRESSDYRTAKQSLLDEVDDIDTELKLVRMAMVREARQSARNGGFQNPGFADLSNLGEFRSIGQQVVEDTAFHDWMERTARSGKAAPSPVVELRTLVTEGTPGLIPGGVAGVLLPVGQPYLPNVRRQRLFIRDLITVQQTGLAGVPYVRELNATGNQTSASTVAEGGVKPEASVQFQADFAPVTVIAVNVPISSQAASDSLTLVGYLNGRLVYMLKLREEAEILNGNGVYPDVKGILAYTGAGQVQNQAATAGEMAITLGNAIAKVEIVDGEADGIAVNPQDAWSMFIKRAAGGAGTFDAGTPFMSGVTDTVWGLPLVRTNSLPQGTGVVGSWAMGATWFDRQEANVKVYEQHSDYAVKNLMLIQAEERGALAVIRPDWFVKATLS